MTLVRFGKVVNVLRNVVMSWLLAATLSGTSIASNEVVITVTVKSEQAAVPNLDPADFVIIESGTEQSITSATPIKGVPTAFTLLIDASNSMETEFEDAPKVALEFARRLGPDDVAQVIGVSSQVRVLVSFTNDAAPVERAIRGLRSEGSTSLHNALYATLKRLLSPLVARSGTHLRNVVIVLSDGEDTSSLVPFNQVLDQARRSQAIVYAIGPHRSASRDRAALQRLVTETGGGWIVSNSPRKEPKAFVDFIHGELASQYEIRYTSTNTHSDGKWRPLEVRSRRPGLKVRARSGYFAARENSERR